MIGSATVQNPITCSRIWSRRRECYGCTDYICIRFWILIEEIALRACLKIWRASLSPWTRALSAYVAVAIAIKAAFRLSWVIGPTTLISLPSTPSSITSPSKSTVGCGTRIIRKRWLDVQTRSFVRLSNWLNMEAGGLIILLNML